MDSAMAHKMWEVSNNVTDFVGGDEIYYYNQKAQQTILQAKPWDKDPHYFKEVKVSALALLRMVMHAKSGGSLEVMGLLQGKVDGRSLIVMDAFALPVEGTETRVNAHQQAYEFMVHYIETARECGRLENVVGWYHSHPGYGCWLSGIDVATQMAHQQFEDPYVAIVIDPIRTVSAGKVNMGAFRTYPKGFKPPDDGVSEYQSIPLSKIEDFGVHCKSYYALELSYFKSNLDKRLLDSLWHRYWISTLSGNALLSNFDYANAQLFDLADKLEQAEQHVQRGLPQQRATVFDPISTPLAGSTSTDKAEDKLAKTVRDGCMHVTEMLDGLMAQAIKNELFRQCFAKRALQQQQQASQPSTSTTAAASAGASGSQQSTAISASISSNTLQMDTN